MLSARNQIPATVVSVTAGTVMAEVVLKDDFGQSIVSVITKASALALGLKPGDRVKAIVKSTEVMIETQQPG